MFIDALVLEEGERQFQTKQGPKREYQLSIRDHEKGQRCKNNFTYVLSPDEVDKFKGKLRDQMVRLQVIGIMPGFNGELRVEGRLEVPPAKS